MPVRTGDGGAAPRADSAVNDRSADECEATAMACFALYEPAIRALTDFEKRFYDEKPEGWEAGSRFR
jgi:hypothetical protein